MSKEFLSIKSSYDDLRLYATVFVPDSDPIGIVQVMHGMMEVRQNYEHLGTTLSSKGFVVVVPDLRGHGDTIDENHPLGFFANENGWITTLRDMNMFTQWVRERYRNLPFFIYGHSMGSLFARSFLKRYEYKLSGLILSGSPAPHFAVRTLENYVDFRIKNEGLKAPSNFFHKVFFGSLDSKFKDEAIKNAWLSHDINVVKEYNNNDKCGFVFTHGGVKDLAFGMRDVYVNKDWHKLKPWLPILFVVGKQDSCANYPSGISSAIKKLQVIGYRDIELYSYEGRRHVLHQGKGSTQFLNDISEWLVDVISQIELDKQ